MQKKKKRQKYHISGTASFSFGKKKKRGGGVGETVKKQLLRLSSYEIVCSYFNQNLKQRELEVP